MFTGSTFFYLSSSLDERLAREQNNCVAAASGGGDLPAPS